MTYLGRWLLRSSIIVIHGLWDKAGAEDGNKFERILRLTVWEWTALLERVFCNQDHHPNSGYFWGDGSGIVYIVKFLKMIVFHIKHFLDIYILETIKHAVFKVMLSILSKIYMFCMNIKWWESLVSSQDSADGDKKLHSMVSLERKIYRPRAAGGCAVDNWLWNRQSPDLYHLLIFLVYNGKIQAKKSLPPNSQNCGIFCKQLLGG